MKISQREYQIAELIAWGATDKEVACELDISPETAKTHRKNILQKIDGHNAADLTRWFFSCKSKVSFGINPRTVRHLACFMLLLIGISEYTKTDIIRTNMVRVSRAQRTSRRSSSKKSYKLQAA
jgi:DNA-binding CsgD family transcriptional regulator